MSRLLNMADEGDRALLKRLQDERAVAIRAIMDDPSCADALDVLILAGHEPAHIHGAAAARRRALFSAHGKEPDNAS